MEGEEECQPVPHHRAAVSDTTDAAGWGRGGGGRGWASLGPGLGLGLQQRLSLAPCAQAYVLKQACQEGNSCLPGNFQQNTPIIYYFFNNIVFF